MGANNTHLAVSKPKKRYFSLTRTFAKKHTLNECTFFDANCQEQLKSVSFASMPNLSTLSVTNCAVSAVPRELCSLYSHTLSRLNLSNNLISSLPDAFSDLQLLEVLDLSNNHFSHIPSSIFELSKLTQLYLAQNNISVVEGKWELLVSLETLSLDSNVISALPDSMKSLTILRKLQLSSNKFSALPAVVCKITSLSTLNASSNKLTTLPGEFGQLTNLQELLLKNNELKSLPPQFGKLCSLKTLDLTKNQLTTLPSSICDLSQLNRFYIQDNKLKELPEAIHKLTSLQMLYCHRNELAALPAGLCKLKSLRELQLSCNRLTDVPKDLTELTELRKLNLSKNKLVTFTLDTAPLRFLTVLTLDDNGITSLPPEVTANPLVKVSIARNPVESVLKMSASPMRATRKDSNADAMSILKATSSPAAMPPYDTWAPSFETLVQQMSTNADTRSKVMGLPLEQKWALLCQSNSTLLFKKSNADNVDEAVAMLSKMSAKSLAHLRVQVTSKPLEWITDFIASEATTYLWRWLYNLCNSISPKLDKDSKENIATVAELMICLGKLVKVDASSVLFVRAPATDKRRGFTRKLHAHHTESGEHKHVAGWEVLLMVLALPDSGQVQSLALSILSDSWVSVKSQLAESAYRVCMSPQAHSEGGLAAATSGSTSSPVLANISPSPARPYSSAIYARQGEPGKPGEALVLQLKDTARDSSRSPLLKLFAGSGHHHGHRRSRSINAADADMPPTEKERPQPSPSGEGKVLAHPEEDGTWLSSLIALLPPRGNQLLGPHYRTVTYVQVLNVINDLFRATGELVARRAICQYLLWNGLGESIMAMRRMGLPELEEALDVFDQAMKDDHEAYQIELLRGSGSLDGMEDKSAKSPISIPMEGVDASSADVLGELSVMNALAEVNSRALIRSFSTRDLRIPFTASTLTKDVLTQAINRFADRKKAEGLIGLYYERRNQKFWFEESKTIASHGVSGKITLYLRYRPLKLPITLTEGAISGTQLQCIVSSLEKKKGYKKDKKAEPSRGLLCGSISGRNLQVSVDVSMATRDCITQLLLLAGSAATNSEEMGLVWVRDSGDEILLEETDSFFGCGLHDMKPTERLELRIKARRHRVLVLNGTEEVFSFPPTFTVDDAIDFILKKMDLDTPAGNNRFSVSLAQLQSVRPSGTHAAPDSAARRRYGLRIDTALLPFKPEVDSLPKSVWLAPGSTLREYNIPETALLDFRLKRANAIEVLPGGELQAASAGRAPAGKAKLLQARKVTVSPLEPKPLPQDEDDACNQAEQAKTATAASGVKKLSLSAAADASTPSPPTSPEVFSKKSSLAASEQDIAELEEEINAQQSGTLSLVRVPGVDLLSPYPPASHLPQDAVVWANENGKVVMEAASVSQLVMKLTSADQFDSAFQSEFLATFPLFTTPEDLFAMLRNRYTLTKALDVDPKVQQLVRMRVLLAFRAWIESGCEDFNQELMRSLVEFFDSVDAEQKSVAEMVKAQLVGNKSTQAVMHTSSPMPEPILPAKCNDWSFSTVDEREMARQICLVSFKYFRALPCDEFREGHFNKPERCPNIAALTNFFNRLSAIVAGLILKETVLRNRVLLFCRLISIAWELRQLNNFLMLMAFITAFNNAAISRLKWTISKFPKAFKRKLEELEALMSIEGSFRAYRAAIVQAPLPCVPYVGVYLQDIVFMKDGNPDRIHNLVNFGKCRLIFRILAQVKKFQQSSYNFFEVAEIQELLTRPPDVAPDAQYDVSLQLEPRNVTRSEIE